MANITTVAIQVESEMESKMESEMESKMESEMEVDTANEEETKVYRNYKLSPLTLLSETEKIPVPPKSPVPRLKKRQLLPPTPRIHVEKSDWEKPGTCLQLQSLCQKYSVVLISGLTAACEMNLDLFSTKVLAEMNPTHDIEMCEQKPQSFNPYKNINKKSWECETIRFYKTIAQCANYIEKLGEKKENAIAVLKSSNNIGSVAARNKAKNNMYFGIRSNLSDEKKWKLQLQELKKLPDFLQIKSENNMLNYLNCEIMGVNAAQLSILAPKCRLSGDQNSFCTVIINTGPGDCEWHVVPKKYWGTMYRLCQRKNLKFLYDSWWPDPFDIYDANIPQYKFYQRVGEIVWLNTGCVHWMESVSLCNIILWSVGSFSVKQYKFAIQQYEWSKQYKHQLIVPMAHLSWHLLRDANVSSNHELCRLIEISVRRMLKHSELVLDFLKFLKIPIFKRLPTKISHYCINCRNELFSFIFVKQENFSITYCACCVLDQFHSYEELICIHEILRSLSFHELSIEMDAKTIVETCKDKELFGLLNFSILDGSPLPPDKPAEQLTKEQLFPLTPCLEMTHKHEVFSSSFQEICMNSPIVGVRDIRKTLDLNLAVFWSHIHFQDETNSIHSVEAYKQIKQITSKNRNVENKDWRFSNEWESKYDTIAQYMNYWYHEMEEKKRISGTESESESDHSSLSSLDSVPEHIIKKQIYLCNVYFLNVERWTQELNKLPPFLQIGSADSMLNYMGENIEGINTVRFHMMVDGNRLTGGQEENNFCAVSLNIGNDICQWYAVPDEYWGAIQSLCIRKGVNYMNDSWWPNLTDLLKENIPVYNFQQRMGDLVWINVGCVYWMQSVGSCNNVMWNVGPLTAKQYQSAIERYEWNRLLSIHSPVPMIRLSWNVAAQTINISDPQLFKLIKTTLLLTMKQCCLLLEFINKKNVKMIVDYRLDKSAFYCRDCTIELFYIVLVYQIDERAYCLYCALKKSPSLDKFTCLKEHDICYLMDVYDKFTLHDSASSSSSEISTSSVSSLSDK